MTYEQWNHQALRLLLRVALWYITRYSPSLEAEIEKHLEIT
jgi:hypothetical protein